MRSTDTVVEQIDRIDGRSLNVRVNVDDTSKQELNSLESSISGFNSRARVDINSDEAIQGLKRTQDSLKRTDESLANTTKATKDFAAAFRAARNALLTVATVRAVVGAFSSFVDAAREINVQLRELQKVSDDTNLERIVRQAQILSEQTGQSAVDILAMRTELARLGNTGENLDRLVQEQLKLTVAFDVGGEAVRKFFQVAQSNLNLDSSGVSQLSDVIAQVGATSQTNERALLNFINRTSLINQTATISGQSLAAFNAVFEGLAVPTEKAARQLRNIATRFTALDSASVKVRESFALTGLDINEFSERAREDFAGASVEFLTRLREMQDSGQDISTVVAGVFDNVARQGVASLLGSLEDLEKNLQDFNTGGFGDGRVEKEFKAALDSAATQTDIATEKLNNAFARLGDNFTAPFNLAKEAAADLIDGTSAALATLQASIGATVSGFTNLASGNFSKAFEDFGNSGFNASKRVEGGIDDLIKRQNEVEDGLKDISKAAVESASEQISAEREKESVLEGADRRAVLRNERDHRASVQAIDALRERIELQKSLGDAAGVQELTAQLNAQFSVLSSGSDAINTRSEALANIPDISDIESQNAHELNNTVEVINRQIEALEKSIEIKQIAAEQDPSTSTEGLEKEIAALSSLEESLSRVTQQRQSARELEGLDPEAEFLKEQEAQRIEAVKTRDIRQKAIDDVANAQRAARAAEKAARVADAKERRATFTSFSQFLNNAVKGFFSEAQKLSKSAGDALGDLAPQFLPITQNADKAASAQGRLSRAFKLAEDAAASQFTSIQGLTDAISDLAVNAAQVEIGYFKQQVALENLTNQFNRYGNATKQSTDQTLRSLDALELLSDTDTQSLRDEIIRVQDELQAVEDSANSARETLEGIGESLIDELDELEGNTEAIEARAQQRRLDNIRQLGQEAQLTQQELNNIISLQNQVDRRNEENRREREREREETRQTRRDDEPLEESSFNPELSGSGDFNTFNVILDGEELENSLVEREELRG